MSNTDPSPAELVGKTFNLTDCPATLTGRHFTVTGTYTATNYAPIEFEGDPELEHGDWLELSSDTALGHRWCFVRPADLAEHGDAMQTCGDVAEALQETTDALAADPTSDTPLRGVYAGLNRAQGNAAHRAIRMLVKAGATLMLTPPDTGKWHGPIANGNRSTSPVDTVGRSIRGGGTTCPLTAHQECALRRLATGAATQQIKFQTRAALVRRNLIDPSGVGVAALTATGRVEALRALREVKACHDSLGMNLPGNTRAIHELEGLMAA